jgi:hypothetical protein
MLPGLHNLAIHGAKHVDVEAGIPQKVILAQVESNKLQKKALQSKGILASAGLSKKLDLRNIMLKDRPTASWTDRGWLYAYWAGGSEFLVAQFHYVGISFALLGGYSVDPAKYILANFAMFWSASGRSGNGSIIDIFMVKRAAREFFAMVYNAKGFSHFKLVFNSVDDVMESVRLGKRLPMMWSDDGMDMIEKYVSSFKF